MDQALTLSVASTPEVSGWGLQSDRQGGDSKVDIGILLQLTSQQHSPPFRLLKLVGHNAKYGGS